MRNLLKVTMVALVITVIIAVVNTAVAVYPAYTGVKYPETVWSDTGKTGSVTVNVSSSYGIGVLGAYVAIVNASNVSQEYCNATTDGFGVHTFTGLNATYSTGLHEGMDGTNSTYNASRIAYMVYANKSPYGEGYSPAFGIDANSTGGIVVTTVKLMPQAPNVTQYGPRTVWSDIGKSGNVTGQAFTSVNGSIGIPGAYIAIVNASNASQVYASTTADASGRYNFTYINATYSWINQTGPDGKSNTYIQGTHMYMIYANKSPYGDGYSGAFGVNADSNATITTSAIIFPEPVRIELKAERPYISPNSSDNIKITATAYDAMGNPVANGYIINFTVASTGGSYDPQANGSLDYPGNTANVYQGAASGNTGATSVQFGWVSNPHGSANTTVRACWYDSDKPGVSGLVNASIKIYYDTGATQIVGLTVNATQMNVSNSIKASYYLLNADPAGNDVQLAIYDAGGSQIRTIDAGIQAGGPYDLIWDGRYSNGTYVPAGAYTLKMFARGGLPTGLTKQWEYMNRPWGAAVDSRGNIIVTDMLSNVTKRIYPNGTVAILSGSFYFPVGVAVDSHDNIYVADAGHGAVKVIYPNGTVATLGSGFKTPTGVAVDSGGSVYVADEGNNATERIYPNGTVVTLGSGFYQPWGIAVDPAGNIYVTERENQTNSYGNGSVKKIYPNNTVVTLSNMLMNPVGVAADSSGNVYVTDVYDANNAYVMEFYPNNTTRIVYRGFSWPFSVAVDSGHNVFVADANYNNITEIHPDGSAVTVNVGFNLPGAVAFDASGNTYVSDLGDGTVKVINADGTIKTLYTVYQYPYGLAVSPTGSVYVTDSDNSTIYAISPDGTRKSLGSGFNHSEGLAIDGQGNVYVADTFNNATKMIYPNNTVVVLNGSFIRPNSIAVDSRRNVYVSSYMGQVGKIYPNGTMILLGNGSPFIYPESISVDDLGNAYVADTYNDTVEMIYPNGTIITLIDGLHGPSYVAVDPRRNLYVTDNNGISEFSPRAIAASDPVTVNVNGGTFTYVLPAGWSMISVPLTLSNTSIGAFFPPSVIANLTDMWYYNNGSWIYYSGTRGYSPRYAHLTDVIPGKGYWVKLSSSSTFTISGIEQQIGVPPAGSGWTMVGVEGLSSFNATASYPGTKDLWYYNNSQWYYNSGTRGYSPRYPHLDSLDPGKGYWVHY